MTLAEASSSFLGEPGSPRVAEQAPEAS